MYETNANEIGFDFDLVITMNREPATPQEWEMVSEFVEENFPLSPDESSHGYSSNVCTFNLPDEEAPKATNETATREQAETIARESWGYNDPKQWDAHGVNTTSVWQRSGGHYANHWYITRSSAFDVTEVRMGRTLAQLLKHQQDLEDARNETAKMWGSYEG
jgi:hypothetical protein